MTAARRVRLGSGGAAELARGLRPPPASADLAAAVAEIVKDVRRRGDAAVVEQVRRFDCTDFDAGRLRVPAEEVSAALTGISDQLRVAIVTAAAQVRALAEALVPDDQVVELPYGQRIAVRALSLAAAGVYAPGGRAAYPSSLIMSVVPAQAAGVERIAVVSPPGPDGRPATAVLAAAAALGVQEVYAAGGPAAIAALALGTATIAPVSVITGPGSPWVQEAKRQLAGEVGIDSAVAGPSEVLVIADDHADAAAVAADLLAQAEHGPDSPAVLASADAELLDAVAGELATAPGEGLGPITLVECDGAEDALELAETFAPEHLEVIVRDPERLLGRIRSAGAVFVGRNGAAAFGDYVAGSNHVLPTGGAARFASALGPTSFMRRMSVVELSDDAVAALTPHLAALADAEGFPHHRRSAELRLSS